MTLGPVERLWDDTPPAAVESGNYTIGTPFTVDVAGVVTAVRYYHYPCASPDHPVSLWASDGTKVAAATDPAPTDVEGWREVPLLAPVPLDVGTFVATFSSLTGSYGTSPGPIPPDLAPSLTGGAGIWAFGSDRFPDQTSGGLHYHVDVVFQSGTPDVVEPAAPGRRDDIVAALSAVPGLAASPVTPDSIVAGAAWPVWASSTLVTGCYWRTLWYVFVALSNGQGDATSAEGDPLVEAVGTALTDVGLGGLICEPWVWPVEVGGQTVPVLRFTAYD